MEDCMICIHVRLWQLRLIHIEECMWYACTTDLEHCYIIGLYTAILIVDKYCLHKAHWSVSLLFS